MYSYLEYTFYSYINNVIAMNYLLIIFTDDQNIIPIDKSHYTASKAHSGVCDISSSNQK